ncbi:MAG: hypothetical protein KAT00_15355 [Planctomycetes bacterium]|nr:hypothetical protein [Planctomycetota bacterium]
MNQQRQLADKMRAAQGQTPAVGIEYKVQTGEDENGKPVFETQIRSYVFKKLKRKKCHQVLHSLVAPFIRVVSTLIETVAVPIGALIKGEADFDFDKAFKEGKFNTESLAGLVESMPFEQYWALAQNILNGVEVDKIQLGNLDDHEFFDDKPLEMVKAILKGVEVNYPFLKDMMKSKGSGSKDSPPENQVQSTG